MGIVLAVVLAVGAVGGWMVLRASDDKEPIVVGTTTTPTWVDPAAAWDAAAWALMSNVFQSLLAFAPGQDQPVPDAAEECGFTDDEIMVFRCTLRSDLVFSNGNEVTAEDVEFSYERILAMGERAEEDDSFDYSGPAGLLGTLEEVRTDGRDVIFELNQPDATFPYVVAGAAGSIVDRESYEEKEPRTDGEAVGSGPFLLTGFEPEELAELEPNPLYRGAFDLPEYPVTVRYFVEGPGGMPAEELLADAWEDGELDVNEGVMPPEIMAQLNPASTEYRFFESTGGSIRTLSFALDRGGPFADVVARRAVASLLDRDALTRHVHRNTVEALYSLIPAGFTGHGTPFSDQYSSRDPDEVRQEMEDAGLELPVPFELAYSRSPATHEEAQLIKEQLEADGLFEVEIEFHPWGEFTHGVFVEGSYDAYLIGWRPDYPDPATFTDGLLGPPNGLGTGFSNGLVNGLIAATQAEEDRARSAQAFREIHERAAEETPIIPIWQEKRIALSTPDITGIQYLADNSSMWRLWELGRI